MEMGKIMKKGYRIKNKRRLKHMPHKSILITYSECRWLYHSTKMTNRQTLLWGGGGYRQFRHWRATDKKLVEFVLSWPTFTLHPYLSGNNKKVGHESCRNSARARSKWNININYHRYKDYIYYLHVLLPSITYAGIFQLVYKSIFVVIVEAEKGSSMQWIDLKKQQRNIRIFLKLCHCDHFLVLEKSSE